MTYGEWMEIFKPAVIHARRLRTEQQLNPILQKGDLILILCGGPLQKPGGLDQTYDFLPHPEYYWLTGSRRPGGVLAYTSSGGWLHFVEPVTLSEQLWEGNQGLIEGVDVRQLASWIAQLRADRIFVLGQSGFAGELKIPDLIQDEPYICCRDQLQEALNQVRRVKDQAEIDLVMKAAGFAQRGYELIKKIIRPGLTERQVQIEYESEVLRAGAEKFPYGTIVGAGTHAAILHATPSNRRIESGHLVLIDAGADVHDYCVDITRVFSADSQFTEQQKSIYQLVYQAQAAAIEKCRIGVEWTEVHLTAAQVIAEGLRSLGILKGEVGSILESGAISVFFPHGVGHMVGLRVRDVGGRWKKPPAISCGARLRVDLPLQLNYLMTVEPGVYFVPAALEHEETRRKYRDQIQWSEIEHWKNFGGVRLEDDILITDQGPRNLTALVEK
jgi:Xaa-Pro aminopeptidase